MNYFEITFEPTPELGASVYREMLWKRQAAPLICSAAIAMVAIWRLLLRREVEFWAFWLGVVATFWYLWWQGARSTRAAVAARIPLTVHMAVNEDGCTFQTEISSQWFSWSEVERVDRLKSAVLLQRRNGSNPIPVPLSALKEEDIAAVVELARGAGARIG